MDRTKDRIHDNNRKYNNRTFDVAGCHRDDRGSDQDDNEQIGKLVKKDRSNALFLLLDQSIFTIGLKSLFSICSGKSFRITAGSE